MANKPEVIKSENVILFPAKEAPIDLKGVKHRRHLRKAVIKPAQREESVELEHVVDRSAEAIKDLNDIRKVCVYLMAHNRYRDYMLFVMGINFGLRVSDLQRLRFCHILNEDFSFKESFELIEKKTANTRKKKRNRHILVNDAVMDAVEMYLEHTTRPVYMDDYLFRSESNGKYDDKPLTRMSVNRILKSIGEDCGLDMRLSSHSFRKTFGYHQMVMSGNDPRKLIILQKMFGHSSIEQTLTYIGITSEEIDEAYRNLNLGGLDYSTLPVKEMVTFIPTDLGTTDCKQA